MNQEWIQLMKVIGIGIIVTGYIILFISEYSEWEEMKKGGSFSIAIKLRIWAFVHR